MAASRLELAQSEFRRRLLLREGLLLNSIESDFKSILELLDKKSKELSSNPETSISRSETLRRIEEIRKQIESQVVGFSARLIASSSEFGKVVARDSVRNAESLVRISIGSEGSFNTFNPDTITEIQALLSENSPYFDIVKSYPKQISDVFRVTMIEAIFSGRNPTEVARTLQSRVGLVGHSAKTVARTVIISAYRNSSLRAYRLNRDIVTQWEWNADKSATTCPMCLAMDGRRFDIDEDFASHPNCRCSPIPVVESIVLPEDEAPTGSEWLKDQSPEVIKMVLGIKGADLYTRGEIDLSDFIGERDDPNFGKVRFTRSIKSILSQR
jgi:SPP1 gp7 family putative phage head morphogenesis protein